VSRGARARRIATAAVVGGGGVGIVAAGGYALLASQARLARRTVGDPTGEPPEADGRYGDGSGAPIQLVLLGDSSAMGLGVATPDETPGAHLALAVTAETGRPVDLTTVAKVGAVSQDLQGQVDRSLLITPDLAVIMIGANDVTHKVRPSEAVRHLVSAVERLIKSGCGVVVATCPDLGTIEPIAQPLRTVARRWSRLLAAAQTIGVVEAGGRTVSIGDLLGPEFAARRDVYFSADRFHPSAAGYARAAGALLPSLLDVLAHEPSHEVKRDGERFLPVARAAIVASERSGSEVEAAGEAGAVRGRRGRWAFLRGGHDDEQTAGVTGDSGTDLPYATQTT
jgi:lysophospholipase L1-like esterase